MSGRGRGSLAEDARLFGQTSFIYEAGACVVLDGEEHWLTGDLQPGGASRSTSRSRRPARRRCCSSTTPAGWSTTTRGTPAARSRTCSAASSTRSRRRRCSAERGITGLRLVDNGAVHRRSPALAALPQVRAYHLRPEAASKANGVAFHLRARGSSPPTCSPSATRARTSAARRRSGTFWLVANAVEHDPSIREAMAQYDNVRVAEASYGAGVYEAVVTTLAERRSPSP